MTPPGRVEFLDRRNYRQRRLRDAARMLPLFGGVLIFLPLMWAGGEGAQSRTSTGYIYLFGLWFFLVVLAAVLAKVLRPTDADVDADTNKTRAGR